MVRKFAADGELLSLFAPYVCRGCKKEFEQLVDLRAQHEQVAKFAAPKGTCPHCGGEGDFDDVPSSYFAFAAQAKKPEPPPIVDQLLGGGATPAGSTFRAEKDVRGTVTAIRFSGDLDGR